MWRSHFAPHIVFVFLLAISGTFGGLRLLGHLRSLEETRLQLTLAKQQISEMRTLHDHLPACVDNLAHFMNHPSRDWQERFRSSFGELAAASTAIEAVPPRFHGFRAEIARMEQHLTRWSAWSPDEQAEDVLADLDNGLRRLNAHWGAMVDHALSTVVEQAKDTEMKQQALLREAFIGIVLWSALAMAYLVIVQIMLAVPVERLARVMRAVRKGDLQARAKVASGSPVGRLAQDSNLMVDALVETLSEQEQTVATLRRTNEELVAANRHKNMFLAMVSHELKTPLNAIIGFADILSINQPKNLTDKQLDFVQRIFTAGQHLQAMISDLIDIAKIDVNAIELSSEAFDVGELLREVYDMLANESEQEGQSLVLSIPETAIPAELDRTRVKQIIVNLAANAVKFTPEGGRVELVARTDGEVVKLRVVDDGIGIALDQQERIFGVFVQGDARLQRQHEGVGLGLALTKRLVNLMAGTIGVSSKPGEGAAFDVTLPLRRPEPEGAQTT